MMGFVYCPSQTIYLGVQSGLENTFRDKTIGKHINYAVLLQLLLNSEWSLKISTEYFQKKHYGPEWVYECRGTTYIIRDAQLWRNSSLNIEINKRVFKGIYLGGGISGNIIKFKRVIHNPYWPLLFTVNDKAIPNEIENRNTAFIRFGLIQTGGWKLVLWKNLIFMLEERYALLFVGREFGHGTFNILESISIRGGLNFGF